MKALATSLLIIYGLSIMGYALLDVTHELLHKVKNPFHQHEVKAHTHQHKREHDHYHHHVEDHHKFLTKSDTSDKRGSSINISWYFFFFHGAPRFINTQPGFSTFVQVLNTRLPIVFLKPPSPPPLNISIF